MRCSRRFRPRPTSAFRRGDFALASRSLEELADVATRADRPEDALEALARLRTALEGADRSKDAAAVERRRATLFLDARGDATAASAALARAFELAPEVETATQLADLAARRGDTRARAGWLQRSVPLLPTAEARATALVQIAELHAGPLGDEAGAESVVRDALAEVPGHPAAESLLVQLLERSGRGADLAAYYVAAARSRTEGAARAHLLRRAAGLYRGLGKDDQALDALSAAHGSAPADTSITAELADLLVSRNQDADAAPFDALLLQADPFHPVYQRHAARLAAMGDRIALGRLEVARAERQVGAEAARSWLGAAAALRAGGREDEARAAEDRAFDHAPELDAAFAARRARVEGDVRALAELLAQRARAVPTEAPALLAERAELLTRAGEALLAAEAWDELLGVRPDEVKALLARGDLAAAAGGPTAAQPYDRRALQLAPDLPTAQRTRLQLRLGNAALSAGALHDAADALEAVVAADPDGERGREALSLLAEVHGRRQDAPGLFRTSVLLARAARPEEAEALYRRASALVEDPVEALEALLPLAELRPAESAVVDRALAGLRAVSRHDELLALLERGAQASGGSRAADLLMEAAQVATEVFHDEARALALVERAHQADPENLAALRALAESYRRRRETEPLVVVLRGLVAGTPQSEESAPLKLELARLLLQRGETDEARGLLEPLAAGGRSGPGYAEALELLVPLLDGADDALARSTVLAARAEMAQGSERARLLYEAARAAQQAGDEARAARLARASVATEASQDALLLLASLMRDASEMAKAAASLTQAAQLASPEDRPRLLLEAADAWESARDPAEAQELLERVARLHPETLGPGAWAARFLRLGARAPAIEHGYEPLLAQGAFAQTLEIAEALEDAPRIRQSLWGLAQAPAGAEALRRLGKQLLREGTGAERQACAELAESRRAMDLAVALHRAILLSPAAEASDEERLRALQRLQALGELNSSLLEALERVDASTSPALVEALLQQLRNRRGAERERGLRLLAARAPSRAAELWQALFEQARDDNRLEDAASALAGWVEATPDPVQRAGLRVQAGDLALAIGWTDAARATWAQAAAEDPTSVQAASKLLALTSAEADPGRVRRAGRAAELAGRRRGAQRPAGRAGARLRPAGPGRRRAGRPVAAPGDRGADPASGRSSPSRSAVRRRRSRSASSWRTPPRNARPWRSARSGRTPRRRGSHPRPDALGGVAVARVAARVRHRAGRDRGGRAAGGAALDAPALGEPGGCRGLGAACRGAPALGTSRGGHPLGGLRKPLRRRGDGLRAGPRGARRPGGGAHARSPCLVACWRSPPRRCRPSAPCWRRRSPRSGRRRSRSGWIRPGPRRPGSPGRTTWCWAPERSRCSVRWRSPSWSRSPSRSVTRDRR